MIESHYSFAQVSYDRTIKLYSRLRENELAMIQKNPGYQMHTRLKTNLIDTFPMEAIQNPNSYHAWLYVIRASQLGHGIFQSNAHDGQPFPFFYDDEYLEVVGKRDPEHAEHPVWLLTLYSSIIARNHDAIAYLTAIDNDVFKTSNYGNQLKPFDYALANIFKGLFNPSADLANLIEQAYLTCNPDDYVEDEAYLYASRLKWPLIPVITAIFTDNGEQEYNQAMEKALQAHKEYYGNEDRMWSNRGAVSLPLTALAIIAKDVKGYKLTVENGYIPAWLIDVTPPTEPN
ncbi:immunity 49 family protein [Pseudoalteromonas shioyasakiensis]|uniref:immunity 49 family protein n=1 Tax=Pseudoalteromonas shioyasakiensis TaxID=1190813 RepID=UPI001EFDF0DB|nr:immunity 49 family protein [Pseudoalteromonas shioyasakiensis]MCG9736229.1 immunity 49 family protein [Pseudoalteromonas shioyasakiensis]